MLTVHVPGLKRSIAHSSASLSVPNGPKKSPFQSTMNLLPIFLLLSLQEVELGRSDDVLSQTPRSTLALA